MLMRTDNLPTKTKVMGTIAVGARKKERKEKEEKKRD